MTSDERELKRLLARRLPSHLESVATRDRVLNELRVVPPHLQRARLTDSPLPVSWLRTALPVAAAAAVVAADGNGRWCAADRMRKRGEPAHRARGVETEGVRRPSRPRPRPRPWARSAPALRPRFAV